MVNKQLDYIDAPEDTFQEYLDKAIKYNVRAIFAKPHEFHDAEKALEDTDIMIAGAIDFPAGHLNLAEKLKIFEEYSKYPYAEIDYVLNQKNIEARNFSEIYVEMEIINQFCREHSIKDKVIVEMCKLDGDESAKLKIIDIANQIKPSFLKTSSGRSFKGADINDVGLMKNHLIPDVKIKASGGIKTLKQFNEFIQAGADVIGASAALEIIEEFNHQ